MCKITFVFGVKFMQFFFLFQANRIARILTFEQSVDWVLLPEEPSMT